MVLPRTPATGLIPVLSDEERKTIETEMKEENKKLNDFMSYVENGEDDE